MADALDHTWDVRQGRARVLVEDVFQIVCVRASGGFQHQQPGRGAAMLRADQLPNVHTFTGSFRYSLAVDNLCKTNANYHQQPHNMDIFHCFPPLISLRACRILRMAAFSLEVAGDYLKRPQARPGQGSSQNPQDLK